MQTLLPKSFQKNAMWKFQIESGDLDTVGYATISNVGTLGAFTGATVPAIPSATYDLDVTVDGGALRQLAIALLVGDSWTQIAGKIQVALRAATSSTETVTITSGQIKISSATDGVGSSVLIAAGTAGSGGGDLLTAIDAIGTTYITAIASASAGVAAASGYATISNSGSLGAFTGATVPAIPTQTDYELDITIDSTPYQLADIDIDITDDWDTVAAAIQTSLRTATSSTETVVVTGGVIKVTSATTGAASNVTIAAGTAGTGSGDLLAVIDALGTTYVTVIESAVAGIATTSGYGTISNTGVLGTFTGATVPALASATYDLDITVDGGALRQTATALLNTDDWDGICAKIQVALRALTTSTETVAISAGKIKVTSATTGVTSTILIAAGTAGSGGGDLITAITALGADYTATIDTPVAGVNATSGYQEVSNSGTLGAYVGVTVPALAAATYDLDITIDGGALRQLAIALLSTDDWTDVTDKIQVALRAATSSTETVAIVGNNIRVTSATTGAASSVLVAAGTAGSGGGDLLAAIDAIGTAASGDYTTTLDTPVVGIAATSGYQEITNTGSLGAYVGATVPAITASTYDLDITIDGGALRQLAIALLATDDWDDICTKIQVALRAATSSTETVAIAGSNIRVTSATSGGSSSVLIAAGTVGSAGGDLLAAIDAIGVAAATSYANSLDTPSAGDEGTFTVTIDPQASVTSPGRDLSYLLDVKTSANVHKTGLKSSYSTTTGILTVIDNGSTTELATGDIVTVLGHFYS